MEFKQIFYVLFLLCLCPCLCLEPVSTTVSVAGGLLLSFVYATWDYTKCKRQECCDNQWIKFNYSALLSTFKRSLHGQHLVERTVARALKGHLENQNPQKALVMSFHGATGIGKNYVSQFIAENLYYEGMNSKFVHLYVSTVNFPHEENITEYQDKLQKEVKEYTQLCQRSLFIFDEVDKMPSGVIDVLKPYMDYYNEIDGVDYRKNIFIFLSNAGGNEIAKVTLSFWADGRERTEMRMKDLENLINRGAFNENGGLKHSVIIKRSLIDLFVPFLPLERKHVELCVRDKLRARYQLASQNMIDAITNQIEYYPKDLPLFSESGCKRIEQKIDIILEDDDDDQIHPPSK